MVDYQCVKRVFLVIAVDSTFRLIYRSNAVMAIFKHLDPTGTDRVQPTANQPTLFVEPRTKVEPTEQLFFYLLQYYY